MTSGNDLNGARHCVHQWFILPVGMTTLTSTAVGAPSVVPMNVVDAQSARRIKPVFPKCGLGKLVAISGREDSARGRMS